MARTLTLLELRTAVLRRGGVESSADLTSLVLNEYINEGIAELWDILRQKGDDSLVTSATLATSVGVATVALPTTFYKLRKLEIVDASTVSGFRRLRSHDLDSSHLFGPGVVGKAYRYRLQGSNLVLVPTPQAVESLRLWFIPYATILAADVDLLDGFNGYEELVIQLAWRRCLVRQDLDTTTSDREIQRLSMRIDAAADARDAEPFYLSPLGSRGRFDLDDDWEVP